MRYDNPNDSPIPEILRRLFELETQSMLGSSSVTRGQTRIASNEGFLVEGSQKVSGWLIITGTERVVGRLEGTGVFDWSGDMYLRGAQHITGDVTFDGSLRVNGPIDVYGTWKLIGDGEVVGSWKLTGSGKIQGDVEVLGNGKLRVGNMVIDPADGGSVAFPGGAKLQADPGGGARLTQGTNRAYVGPNMVSLQLGAKSFSISASGFTIDGLGTVPSSLANGAAAGTVWMDTSGQVWRVVPG
ncbi:hypothetical protein ABE10_02340 [Bacillus toyonensis]|nr:hypothetical protein [Bacillus toyonensis]